MTTEQQKPYSLNNDEAQQLRDEARSSLEEMKAINRALKQDEQRDETSETQQ